MSQLKIPTPEAVRDSMEAFLIENSMAEWQFGHSVCKDPNLVREIRAGRVLSLVTAGKVAKFMATFKKSE